MTSTGEPAGSASRTNRYRRSSLRSVLAGIVILHSGAALAEADFHGIWVPAPELAEGWDRGSIAMTEQGAEALASYDSRRHDSALYCMPLGTPRNTLATASNPLEILQRPEQITMIFDGRGDVRRLFLDGRDHPEYSLPGWMGHSVGHWNGDELVVDTIAMTAESRLTQYGLPHSDAMRLGETWRLVDRAGETLLAISLRMEDPAIYREPLEATRYFRRAPHATLRETAALCQLDQWRSYLERHSKELSMQLGGLDDGAEANSR